MLFQDAPPNPKTKVWDIKSKSSGIDLGMIKYYGNWHQYCLVIPLKDGTELIYSIGCLQDIIDFISEHKNDRISN